MRRFALPPDNLNPKETPEVIALGGAFLQEAMNLPKYRKRGASTSLTPGFCGRLSDQPIARAGQQRIWRGRKQGQTRSVYQAGIITVGHISFELLWVPHSRALLNFGDASDG